MILITCNVINESPRAGIVDHCRNFFDVPGMLVTRPCPWMVWVELLATVSISQFLIP